MARGEAELGIQPITELMEVQGIDVVGPLPAELQSPDLVYVAGAPYLSEQPIAAKALIDFLTDPKAAAIPLPLGGPKGAGLSLMFEFMAGVQSGAPVLAPALGPQRRNQHTQNAFILVLDVAGFRPPAEFAADADALIDVIKGLPLREGFEEILLPGERGGLSRAARSDTGIPIAPSAWGALGRLARELEIELPATVAATK